MTKLFFDHLVQIEEVVSELDKHAIDPEEKTELLSLIDEQLHHHVLNVILNHLPQAHHQTFLHQLTTSPADPSILAFLKSEIKADIESAIQTQATRVKKEILAEIKHARLKR